MLKYMPWHQCNVSIQKPRREKRFVLFGHLKESDMFVASELKDERYKISGGKRINLGFGV